MMKLNLAKIDCPKVSSLSDVGLVPQDFSHQGIEQARIIDYSRPGLRGAGRISDTRQRRSDNVESNRVELVVCADSLNPGCHLRLFAFRWVDERVDHFAEL
jgi:hypothetical protein